MERVTGPQERIVDDHWILRSRWPLIDLSATQCTVIFALAIVVVQGFILYKALILQNALVIGDEYYYRAQSSPGLSLTLLLNRVPQGVMPNLIYLRIMELIAFVAGHSVYSLAKVLNSIAFLASSVPIFLVARTITGSQLRSAAVGVASLLLADNLFIAYYMPEALYRLGFWLILAGLVVLPCDKRPPWWGGAIGVGIGVLYFIKPHALFVLPAVLFSESVLFACRGRMRLGQFAVFAGGLLLAFVSTIALIKLFLADGPNPQVPGHYDVTVSTFFQTGSAGIVHLLLTCGRALGWNLAVVVAVTGTGLFLVMHRAWLLAVARSNPLPQILQFYIFIAIYLLEMLVVVAKVTVDWGMLDGIELRYYDFTFPAFLIVAFDRSWSANRRTIRIALGMLWVTIAILLLFFGIAANSGLDYAFLATAPEMAILHAPLAMRYAVATSVLFAGLTYVGGIRWRGWAYGVLFCIAVFAHNIESMWLTSQYDARLHYVASSRFLVAQAGAVDLGKGVIISPDYSTGYSLLFPIAWASPRLIVQPTTSPVEIAKFEGEHWVFLVGSYEIRGQPFEVVQSEYGSFVPLTNTRPSSETYKTSPMIAR